jgi:ankyrin repeat protein
MTDRAATMEKATCETMLLNSVWSGNAAELAYWLKRAKDPRRAKNGEDTLAMIAAMHGKAECLAVLAEFGYDMDDRGAAGRSLLHVAAASDRVECVEYLAARGVDVDARDMNGDTPAMEAAYGGAAWALVALVKAGCDVMAKNNEGYSAAMTAAEYGRIDCLRALLAAGCELSSPDESLWPSVLALAISEGHHECAAMVQAEAERRELAGFVACGGLKPRPSGL